MNDPNAKYIIPITLAIVASVNLVVTGMTTDGIDQIVVSLNLTKEILADIDLGLGEYCTLYKIIDMLSDFLKGKIGIEEITCEAPTEEEEA